MLCGDFEPEFEWQIIYVFRYKIEHMAIATMVMFAKPTRAISRLISILEFSDNLTVELWRQSRGAFLSVVGDMSRSSK